MKMKTKTAIAIAILALIAGGAAWKLRDDASPPPSPAADPWAARPRAGDDAAAIIAAKRAARRGAPLDLAPAVASGRITRAPDGSGVAGAVVALTAQHLAGVDLELPDTSIVVVTDATGAWRATAIPPGSYVVAATATGLIPGALPAVSFAAGAAQDGLDLVLGPGGATISGVVSDISGGPIVGARVRAQHRSPARAAGDRAEFVAITDAGGRYQLTLRDAPWEIQADQEDYTAVSRSVDLSSSPIAMDFELVPGAVIHGRVVHRGTGAPVAAATVRAAPSAAFGDTSDELFAITDGAGTFTLRGLPAGAIELTATAHGVASATPTTVELGVGERVSDAAIAVDGAPMISGFVVQRSDRRTAIAGASVSVFSIATGTAHGAVRPSDADGYFEVHGVSAGTYMVLAVQRGMMVSLGTTVTVTDAGRDDVLVELGAGATLSGRISPGVACSIGLELETADLGLAAAFDVIRSAFVSGTSDPSGAFTVRHVPPGRWRLVARTPDGRAGRLGVEVAAEDQSGLAITLEEQASIAGRIVDTTGAAVAGVRVAATERGGPRETAMLRVPNAGVVTTTADGSFRIAGLAAGAVELVVSDEFGPLAWARGEPHAPFVLELAAREQRTGITLTLEPRDGMIRGVVLGADRRPVPDAWITARLVPPNDGDDDDDDDGFELVRREPHIALTGEDGRFTLARLRRGSYELIAETGKGAAAVRRRAVKSGESVTLALEPLGSLAGVLRTDGKPVADYTIECRGATTARRRVSAADGAYAFERLPGGAYTCTATSAAGSATADVTIAGATRLDLATAASGRLTGRIVDARTGAPMPGLRLVTVEDGGSLDLERLMGDGTTTDDAGRFELREDRLGPRGLMVFDDSLSLQVIASAEFTLAAGQRLDLGTLKGMRPRTGAPGVLGLTPGVRPGGKLVVHDLPAGGPAAAAGLRIGDVITAIDGLSIGSLTAEVGERMLQEQHVSAGQRVVLEIHGRAGEVALIAAPR